jgi:hypothetical protein
MHPQRWLQFCPALMLELPAALGVEPVALQRHRTIVHLAFFGIGFLDSMRRDVKGLKELTPGFEKRG